MSRRAPLVALSLLALLGAAYLLGGWPDPAGALASVGAGAVTGADGAALVRLLCWLGVGFMVIVAGASPAVRAVASGRRRRLALLAACAVLLGAGVARHQSAYSVCCSGAGTVERVQDLVR